MNVQSLHTFVMTQFTDMAPAIDEVFLRAQTRTGQGRKTNIKTFVEQLRKVLKPHRTTVSAKVEREFCGAGPSLQWYPLMSAFCYEPSASLKRDARIEIIIGIDPLSRRFDFSSQSWEFFRYRFHKTLLHELVHRAQFASGRHAHSGLVFRPHNHALMDKYHLVEQRYLGEIDEVEAYAHDCVEEWYCLYPNQPLTMKAFRENFRGPRQLPSLSYYHDVFHGDEHHPAIQRLFRKVKAWNEVMTPLVQLLPSFRPMIPDPLRFKGRGFVLG